MARRSNDPIKAGARRARAQRRVGVGAQCTDCGENRPAMLVRSSRPRRCAHCHAIVKGKKVTESHHIAGKANSPVTVELPIKDHRTLSHAQYEWPPPTLQNPEGSPLLALAATLRGIADLVGELVVAFMRYLAETAENIDAWLREQHGRWWQGGPFDGWQPNNG
jgi:hypothetical protein